MKIIRAVLTVAFAAVASASETQGQDEYNLRGPSAVAAAVTGDVVVEDDVPRPVIVDKVFMLFLRLQYYLSLVLKCRYYLTL